jgi:hypothetical protein
VAGRPADAPKALEALEALKGSYGGGAAAARLAHLRTLEDRPLGRAGQVLRLHEVLCFLRAYPDDLEILAQVERMLGSFRRRADLRRHRRALTNTGIAGTLIRFPFFWFTAEWLARRWPERLTVSWPQFEQKACLEDALRMVIHYSEQVAIDELALSPREWVRRLKGPAETDACFIVRRFAAYRGDSFGREAFYERLNIPLNLAPGTGTPSRTLARYPSSPVVFQRRPLSRARPAMRRAVPGIRVTVRPLPVKEARRLIDLARESMITRSRDLDAFEHAYDQDVRVIDCGGGLQFACIGVRPERRLLLESLYGFLTIKNGVPIGYVLVTALFGSSEVAFNMFETYRGSESAVIYSRVLAMVREIFGSDTFTVDPYQLGYANTEGLKSGAWWFYYKLGFRPHDPGVRRLLGEELAKMRRHPGHRSSVPTLSNLASENLYLHLERARDDVLGVISLGDIGLRIARNIAGRFGSDHERAGRVYSKEAARLLGLRPAGRLTPDQAQAWQRWSPLVMSLEGAERWTALEKRALIRVILAKGGRRESDFVRLFDAHRPLRKAILKLAVEED